MSRKEDETWNPGRLASILDTEELSTVGCYGVSFHLEGRHVVRVGIRRVQMKEHI